MSTAIALSQATAQKNKEEIIQLCQSVTLHGIEIGKRLLKAEQEEHWKLLDEEEWEYLRDIGLSQRQANKLKDVVRYVLASPVAKEEEVSEIGTTKLIRLISPARSGKLDEELWAKAVTLSDLDLRRELGHNIPKVQTDIIICPKCGTEIKTFRTEPKQAPEQAQKTATPPRKERPQQDEIHDAPEPFVKTPTVQLTKSGVQLFDMLVKMGLDNDESTRRVAKKILEIHGDKVIKIASDTVHSGRMFSDFSAVLARM